MQAIQHLSRAEKLRMMEELWRDLSSSPDDLTSPAWHANALQEAETAVAGGTAEMLDWECAKELLQQRMILRRVATFTNDSRVD